MTPVIYISAGFALPAMSRKLCFLHRVSSGYKRVKVFQVPGRLRGSESDTHRGHNSPEFPPWASLPHCQILSCSSPFPIHEQAQDKIVILSCDDKTVISSCADKIVILFPPRYASSLILHITFSIFQVFAFVKC